MRRRHAPATEGAQMMAVSVIMIAIGILVAALDFAVAAGLAAFVIINIVENWRKPAFDTTESDHETGIGA